MKVRIVRRRSKIMTRRRRRLRPFATSVREVLDSKDLPWKTQILPQHRGLGRADMVIPPHLHTWTIRVVLWP